jgi:hypothetical protein
MDGEKDILLLILEWAWVGVFATVVWCIRKIFSVEYTVAVVSTIQTEMKEQHDKDEQRRDRQRDENIDTINKHHDRVSEKLDDLTTLIHEMGSAE